MGTRVVVDTNIIVSALGWRGAPHQIVGACLAHHYQLLLSPDLLAEIERVLHYQNFGSLLRRLKIISPGHLLDLGEFEGIPILRPREFVDRLSRSDKQQGS